MNPLTIRERARDGIEEEILKHCGPLIFITSLTPPVETLRNGTYGLVDTGEKKVMVTCYHVWDYLHEVRRIHPKAEIAMNLAPGQSFAISDAEVIDADRDLDIVVVDPKLRDDGFFQKEFFRVQNQPTAPIRAGEFIAFAGYPEAEFVCSENCGTFHSTFFGLQVTSVSDRSILLLNDQNDRNLVGLYNEPLSPIKTSGVSGSPAYRLGAGGLNLVGLVKGGSSTDGLFHLTKICCLNPDGKIQKNSRA
jgi:hypothetical protein